MAISCLGLCAGFLSSVQDPCWEAGVTQVPMFRVAESSGLTVPYLSASRPICRKEDAGRTWSPGWGPIENRPECCKRRRSLQCCSLFLSDFLFNLKGCYFTGRRKQEESRVPCFWLPLSGPQSPKSFALGSREEDSFQETHCELLSPHSPVLLHSGTFFSNLRSMWVMQPSPPTQPVLCNMTHVLRGKEEQFQHTLRFCCLRI